LFPFLDGQSSIKDPGRISPCLLTKILILTKATQSFTAPRLGHNILWETRKDGQKEGVLIIIPIFN
jgi:hypothetical protein